jgi:hypothetical protein
MGRASGIDTLMGETQTKSLRLRLAQRLQKQQD